ncbi:unnamed protein product [Symbiodinium sp. CCMP2592]|nr:unnamed protein product [Symbiodinium sp. CCMP2592]
MQVCVQSFTRALLQGINVCVLLDDNRTRLAEVGILSLECASANAAAAGTEHLHFRYIDGWLLAIAGNADDEGRAVSDLCLRQPQGQGVLRDVPQGGSGKLLRCAVLIIAKGGERTPEALMPNLALRMFVEL